MNEQNIIACICEGSAEQAVIELLLENNKLYFEKQQLLDEKIIRVRSAERFEELYLRKNFNKKITVLRILDSRRENFKLSKLYKDKVEVINIITSPEIEMLIIHNENKYEEYDRSKKKPSDYCKQNLKYPEVKSYVFVKDYFSDIDKLINAIKLYHKKANIPKQEKTLFDLLINDRK
ncbi:hypothetical protein [Hungatella effluvii]|uniref:hypothetical protein n=1 Tax=Hungatella effluvii TaxID=1096246 RepID=UPI0022E3C8C5|nr:hypothetical protein [Hungatella effluvii]